MPSHVYADELTPESRHNLKGDYYDRVLRNVGQLERIASLAGGAALMATGVALGLKRHSPFGLVLAGLGGALAYRGATGHCDVYEHLGVGEEDADDRSSPLSREIVLEDSVEIMKPPQEVYDYWRKLDNLPNIMRHIKRVTRLNATASEWVAEGPLGREVKWRARITDDRPGERISWASVERSEVETSGTVQFTPMGETGEHTLVQVRMAYHPPAGVAGLLVSRMLGANPAQELREDLDRFRITLDSGQTPPDARE